MYFPKNEGGGGGGNCVMVCVIFCFPGSYKFLFASAYD